MAQLIISNGQPKLMNNVSLRKRFLNFFELFDFFFFKKYIFFFKSKERAMVLDGVNSSTTSQSNSPNARSPNIQSQLEHESIGSVSENGHTEQPIPLIDPLRSSTISKWLISWSILTILLVQILEVFFFEKNSIVVISLLL